LEWSSPSGRGWPSGGGGFGLDPLRLDTAGTGIDGGAVRARSIPDLESLRRRRALLPIALMFLTVIASVVTHAAGSGPVSGEVGHEAGEAGEQSAILLPPLLGPLASLLVLAAIWFAHHRSLNSMWFLLVPPLAFGLQELAERLFHVGSVPFGGAEASLMTTVLIQLPFAVLAVVLARLLRAGVRRAIAFLRVKRQFPRARSAFASSWALAPVFVPNLPALAGAHLGRAPPDLR
jgi:hypothetical protein